MDGLNGFFDGMQAWLEKYLLPIADKMASQRHLSAIRNAMSAIIPLLTVGGIALMLAFPPIPEGMTNSGILGSFMFAWQAFADKFYDYLIIPFNLSMGCMALYVNIAVTYYLAESYDEDKINNIIISLVVFLMVCGGYDLEAGAINTGAFGSANMFGAMIMAIAVVELNRFFVNHGVAIRLPEQVPPAIAGPFNLLLALALDVVIFQVLNAGVVAATGASMTQLVISIFQPLVKVSDSLAGVLISNTIIQLFWWFGIHGDTMVAAVKDPIVTANLAENAAAHAAGLPMPHVFAGNMTGTFGGWIVTYAALIVAIFLCKSERIKAVGKAAVVPVIFSITEPLNFGVPLILNPIFFIPYLLFLNIDTTIYYLLAKANIVGRLFVSLPFTTPVPVAAFLSTMDWRCLVLFFFLLVLDIAMFIPFFRMYDKQECELEGIEA